jgi:anti-sigma factor RsiW
MKPTCQPIFSMLSPFVDGELSTDERKQVERHLGECRDCTGRAADLRAESGLIRVGMEMLGDDVDFAAMTQKVMARLTPEKAPFLERLRLSMSELFTYQRGLMVGAMGAAAGSALAVLAMVARPGATPEGYANERMALHSVTIDESAHVAPVMMETDEGDSIIWVVDHTHASAGAPDASQQKEVDSSLPSGQKAAEPKGGEL